MFSAAHSIFGKVNEPSNNKTEPQNVSNINNNNTHFEGWQPIGNFNPRGKPQSAFNNSRGRGNNKFGYEQKRNMAWQNNTEINDVDMSTLPQNKPIYENNAFQGNKYISPNDPVYNYQNSENHQYRVKPKYNPQSKSQQPPNIINHETIEYSKNELNNIIPVYKNKDNSKYVKNKYNKPQEAKFSHTQQINQSPKQNKNSKKQFDLKRNEEEDYVDLSNDETEYPIDLHEEEYIPEKTEKKLKIAHTYINPIQIRSKEIKREIIITEKQDKQSIQKEENKQPRKKLIKLSKNIQENVKVTEPNETNEKKVKITSDKIKSLMMLKLKNIKEPNLIDNNSSQELKEKKYIPQVEIKRQEFKVAPKIKDVSFKAKLTTKCSNKEIKTREEQNNLSVFELDKNMSFYDKSTGRYVVKANPDYCVKAYVRSAADLKMDNPDDIRTESTLLITLNYLLNYVIDADVNLNLSCLYFKYEDTSNTFNEICRFIEDRFRAIRQDLTIIGNKGSIVDFKCNLIISRFLILCLNQCLCYEDFTGNQGLLKLFKDQLNKALASLRESLDALLTKKSEYAILNNKSNNEALVSEIGETYFYSIILNLDQMIDVISIMNRIPEAFMNIREVKLIKRIIRYYTSNDYISFFKLIRSSECSYLEACLLGLYFNKMRYFALSSLVVEGDMRDIRVVKISKTKLSDLLLFEAEECESYLSWFGIDYDTHCIDDCYLIKTFNKKDDSSLIKYKNDTYIEKLRFGKSRKEICLKELNINELIKYINSNSELNKNEDEGMIKNNNLIKPLDNIIKRESIVNDEESSKNLNLKNKLFSFNPDYHSSIAVKEPIEIKDDKVENKNIKIENKEIEKVPTSLFNSITSLFKPITNMFEKKKIEENETPSIITNKDNCNNEKLIIKDIIASTQPISASPLIIDKINIPNHTTVALIKTEEKDITAIYKNKLLPLFNKYIFNKYLNNLVLSTKIKKYQDKKLNSFLMKRKKIISTVLFVYLKDKIDINNYRKELINYSISTNFKSRQELNEEEIRMYNLIEHPEKSGLLFTMDEISKSLIEKSLLTITSFDLQFLSNLLGHNISSTKANNRTLFLCEKSILALSKLAESFIANNDLNENNANLIITENDDFARIHHNNKLQINNISIDFQTEFTFLYIDYIKHNLNLSEYLHINYNDLNSYDQYSILIDFNNKELLEFLINILEMLHLDNKKILIIYYNSKNNYEDISILKENFNDVVILHEILLFDPTHYNPKLTNPIINNNTLFYNNFIKHSTDYTYLKDYFQLNLEHLFFYYERKYNEISEYKSKLYKSDISDKIKNRFWIKFLIHIHQGICTLKVISEFFIKLVNQSDFYCSSAINDLDALRKGEILRDFSEKINSIKIKTVFKDIIRMKNFNFDEFMQKPSYEIFLSILLNKICRLGIIFIERMLYLTNNAEMIDDVSYYLIDLKDKLVIEHTKDNKNVSELIMLYFQEVIRYLIKYNSLPIYFSIYDYTHVDFSLKEYIGNLELFAFRNIFDSDNIISFCEASSEKVFTETLSIFLNKDFQHYIETNPITFEEIRQKEAINLLRNKRIKDISNDIYDNSHIPVIESTSKTEEINENNIGEKTENNQPTIESIDIFEQMKIMNRAMKMKGTLFK